MNVLVTGGGGFLGGYVVRELLQAGHKVTVFQRSPSAELEASGVRLLRGDIAAGEDLGKAVHGQDAVLHIAAMAGVWGKREDYMRINVRGTEHLLECMRRSGVRRLVHCSSPSVVFDGTPFQGQDESLPYGRDWSFWYPESKALAEQRVLEWGRSGHGRAIALRPHLIWGVGDPHLFPTLIERASAGRLRIIGDGTNRIDTTRVENAARAHLLAMEALEKDSAVNRPYFISQGNPVVLWDWINGMFRRVGVPPVARRIPYRLAHLIGHICELGARATGTRRIPPMTRFVAMAMAHPHWFSIEAARRELGYVPEAYPMEAGEVAYARAWIEGRTPTQGR